MNQVLKEQIDKLFAATKDLQSLEEIKPYCEKFNEWLNINTNYSIGSLGKILSRAGFYKPFRSLRLEQGKNAGFVLKYDKEGDVTGIELKHYCVLLCGLDKEDREARNEIPKVSDRVTATNKDGSIGIKINPDEYIEITGRLLESDNPYELAVGLIAATGRPPLEILVRGKFALVTSCGKELYCVNLKGQGKKCGEKPDRISTLFPAGYIIERLRQLRKNADIQALLEKVIHDNRRNLSAQNKAIEDSCGNLLRRVVQEHFGGHDSNKSLLNFLHEQEHNDCKALLTACAALITKKDCQGSINAQMYFAACFLGYITPGEKISYSDLEQIATTLGYLDYYVIEPVPSPHAPDKVKFNNIKVLPDDLEIIKNLQTELNINFQHEVIHELIEKYNLVNRLKEELAEANRRLKEIEAQNKSLIRDSETTQVLESQIITIDINELYALIDAKLEAKFNQLPNNVVSQPTTVTKEVTKPQTKQDDRDWENVSSENLKKLKSVGAINEKLIRCFVAIKTYNSTVATSNDDRWYVGNAVLREMSGCNGQVVAKWLEAHNDLVASHNQTYSLGQYHNKRHKGKSISDVVSW